MSIIVTGIQPTGTGSPHLGNYFGAIKPAAQIIEGKTAFVMVADVHATTVDFNPKELYESSMVTYSALVASGISSEVVFKQSMVPEHFELSTLLSHFASVGVMERMTQFKDKSSKSKDNDSIGFGLLTYPILMAADILAYNADFIPVGSDQDQHVQLTVQLARKVNHKLGFDFFTIPKVIHSDGVKIKDILHPDKKMSKSAENQNGVIYLSDTMDEVLKKMRRAVTDSEPYLLEDKDKLSPGVVNLITILSLMDNSNFDDTHKELIGKRYSELKNRIVESFGKNILPIQIKMNDVLSNKEKIKEDMIISAERSRVKSRATVELLRNKLGLGV